MVQHGYRGDEVKGFLVEVHRHHLVLTDLDVVDGRTRTARDLDLRFVGINRRDQPTHTGQALGERSITAPDVEPAFDVGRNEPEQCPVVVRVVVPGLGLERHA